MSKSPKVAIVHDWLVGGGAELVVLELHKMFPDAPIYTSYCTQEWQKKLDNKVVTGFLQRWPFSKLRKYLAPLRLWWFSRLDLSGYELVISSSGNGEAKGVKTPDTTTHICYCHTPSHFYWRHYEYYKKNPGFKLGGFGLSLLVKPLRRWDFKAAQRPDFYIANSSHIKKDIQKYYKRDAAVVFPPVDVARFKSYSKAKKSGFVTVGRQVPYKRIDLIIKSCTQLNLPLTVVGKGPEHERLKQLAGPTITFIKEASNQVVQESIGHASAFIVAAFEDFGITPVEAIAAGTPVIAFGKGGALDYVTPEKTGMLFTEQSVESLSKTLQQFQKRTFSGPQVSKQADRFSQDKFQKNMREYLSAKGFTL